MTPAELDVFKKTRRILKEAGVELNKADGHAFSSPDRLVLMHSVAQKLRKAAQDIDAAAMAEHHYAKEGWSLYQLDFDGAATPIQVA